MIECRPVSEVTGFEVKMSASDARALYSEIYRAYDRASLMTAAQRDNNYPILDAIYDSLHHNQFDS